MAAFGDEFWSFRSVCFSALMMASFSVRHRLHFFVSLEYAWALLEIDHSELKIDNRMETMAKKQAFITLKDHKDNFENNLPCRLINPAKSETGIIGKITLEKINNAVRSATGVNQWRSSMAVVDWFKSIKDKGKHTFISFDIVDFYNHSLIIA